MSIPILVEPTAGGFRADTGGPLNLSADGPTSHDAIHALQTKINARLQGGAMIVQLPVPPKSPLGRMSEHPLFDEWLQAVTDYRRQREAEEDALEQQGN